MALTHGEKIINLFILQFITLIFLIFIIRSFLLTEVDGMICLSAEKLQLEGKTVIFPLIFTQILWILDIICSYKVIIFDYLKRIYLTYVILLYIKLERKAAQETK